MDGLVHENTSCDVDHGVSMAASFHHDTSSIVRLLLVRTGPDHFARYPHPTPPHSCMLTMSFGVQLSCPVVCVLLYVSCWRVLAALLLTSNLVCGETISCTRLGSSTWFGARLLIDYSWAILIHHFCMLYGAVTQPWSLQLDQQLHIAQRSASLVQKQK